MEKNKKLDTVTDAELAEIAREEERKYRAEWRKANKDKVRATNARYWAKRALARIEREGKSNDGSNA